MPNFRGDDSIPSTSNPDSVSGWHKSRQFHSVFLRSGPRFQVGRDMAHPTAIPAEHLSVHQARRDACTFSPVCLFERKWLGREEHLIDALAGQGLHLGCRIARNVRPRVPSPPAQHILNVSVTARPHPRIAPDCISHPVGTRSEVCSCGNPGGADFHDSRSAHYLPVTARASPAG